MDRETFLTLLCEEGACLEAVVWVSETPGTPQELWEKCGRGDWMLWLCAKLERVPFRQLQNIACDVAERALRFNDDPRLSKALETARAFLEGKTSRTELLRDKEGALRAYHQAESTVTSRAAETVVGAATACGIREGLGYAACHVSIDASTAAFHAHGTDAGIEEVKAQGEIVRRYLPLFPWGTP